MVKLPSPSLRPGSTVKNDIPSSSDNVRAKIEQARQANPAGTTGGAGGQSGAKGSYQQTGGGTSQIVVENGNASLVDSSQATGLVFNPAPQKQAQKEPTQFEKRYDIKTDAYGNITGTAGGKRFSMGGGTEVITSSPTAKLTPEGMQLHSHVPVQMEQRNYILGRIPEKGYAEKTYEELNAEQKRSLLGEILPENRFESRRDIGIGTGTPESYARYKPGLLNKGIVLWGVAKQKYQDYTKSDTATFADVDKILFPTVAREYITQRRDFFNAMPDRSFSEMVSSPKAFGEETLKGAARPIFNLAGKFVSSPVKTTVYTAGMFKALGLLPKIKIVGGALITGFVGSEVIAEPSKFLKPAGYIETGAELGYWTLALKGIERGKGSKAIVKTSSFKSPIDEFLKVAPTGKRGNIQTIELQPNIEYTLQGKRVTPINYAKILSNEGKIIFSTPDFAVLNNGEIANAILRGRRTKQPEIIIGQKTKVYDIDWNGDIVNTPFKLKAISKYKQEIYTAHELIHYKTPSFIYVLPTEMLPYRQRPSEMLAWGLEGRFARKGFAVSPEQISNFEKIDMGKFVVRKDKDLTFEYPRQQLLQKSVGKNAPLVSVSKGNIQRGDELFNLNAVTVGRKTYGSIIGKQQDIIFMKGNKGDMFLKYLSKSGKVIKTKSVPYQPESLKFTYKNIMGRMKEDKSFLDVGVKIGDVVAYGNRNIQRTRRYTATAGEKQFNIGRDISKNYFGQAKSNLFQSDTAGLKTETVKYGNRLSIEKYYPNIKYAMQPKYKSNIKTYSSDVTVDGVIPISKSTLQSELVTARQNKFISESKYTVEKSRYKPVKEMFNTVKRMGTKGQVSLFKRIETLQTKRPTPELYKPNTKIAMSGEELFSLLPRARVNVFPLSYSSNKGMSKLFNESQSKISTRNNTITKMNIENILRVPTRTENRLDIKVFSEVKVPTITKTHIRSESKSLTRTQTITKQMTQTLTMTPTPTRTTTTRTPPPFLFTPPPPPPFIPMFGGSSRKQKKKKTKYKIRNKYLPSLVAIGEGIYGKPNKILGGLEIRPINFKGGF